MNNEAEVKANTREIIADIRIATEALGRIHNNVLGPERESDSPAIVRLRRIQHNVICDLAVAARTLTAHATPEECDPGLVRHQLSITLWPMHSGAEESVA